MRFKKGLILLLLLTTLLLVGCRSGEVKYSLIDEPFYISEGIVYSTLSNTPITGVIKEENYYNYQYLTFKDGILVNAKKVGEDNNIIENWNYTSEGLVDGTAMISTRETKEFSNGVLNGKVQSTQYGHSEMYFIDGVLNGTVLDDSSLGKKHYYFNMGYPSFEKVENTLPTKDRNINWKKTPTKRFSGKIYSPTSSTNIDDTLERVADLRIDEYSKGQLIKTSYYTSDGLKVGEYTFFKESGSTKSLKRFEIGLIQKELNYDKDGNLHGQSLNSAYQGLVTTNYLHGILHGPVESESPFAESEKTSLYSYNLGMLNGEYQNKFYSDGKEVKEYLEREIEQDIKVHEAIDYIESFTGYIRSESDKMDTDFVLSEYKEGTLLKIYSYKESYLSTVKEFDLSSEEGAYWLSNFDLNGILVSEIKYDKSDKKNGPFVSISGRCKTRGGYVDDLFDGEILHIHGEEVQYIDEYKQGKEFTRTTYYNYESGLVQNKIHYKYKDGWIPVGQSMTYDRKGSITQVVDYSDALNRNKKTRITTYYPDGNIELEYDSCSNLDCYTGSYKRFYADGALEYEGVYQNNKRVGTHSWYSEDGSLLKAEEL